MIGRCGQPEVSWWGWRNADDEHLVQAIAKACVTDPASNAVQANGTCVHRHAKAALGDSGKTPVRLRSDCFSCSLNTTAAHSLPVFTSDPHMANGNVEAEPSATPSQKLLIMDARSYAAAVANRAKGGGCECPGNAELMLVTENLISRSLSNVLCASCRVLSQL